MTGTLPLDTEGRLLLPAPMLRALGVRLGVEMRAEVTRGRIELVAASAEELPEITEFSPGGNIRFPAGFAVPSGEEIVAAVKLGREGRMRAIVPMP